MQLAMHHRIFLLVLVATVLSIGYLPHIAYADTPNIFINEFSVDGSVQAVISGVDTYHWVELYNAGSSDVTSGLEIHNGTAVVATVATVPAHGMLVLDVTPLSFPADAGTILLTDTVENTLDSIEYGPEGEVTSPSSDQSAYRTSDGGVPWTLGVSTAGGTNAPLVVDDSYSLNRGASLVVGTEGTNVNQGVTENDKIEGLLHVSNCANGGPCSSPLNAFGRSYPFFVLFGSGKIHYTPADGYSGRDSFHYSAANNLTELLEPSRGVATVTLHVSPTQLVNDVTGGFGAFSMATTTSHPIFSGMAVQMASTSIASVAIAIDGDTHDSGQVVPDTNGNWSFAIAHELPDNVYSVKITATDVSGNTESQQFYLSVEHATDIAVDDDWAGLPAGTSVSLGGSPYTIGTDAFGTVMEAVAYTEHAGVIHVAPGNYDEVVTINQPLTLLGAQAGLAGKNHSGAESVLKGLAVGSSDVTVDGVTIKADGATLVTVLGGGTLQDVVIRNSVLTGETTDGYSTGILAHNTTGVTISNNLFEHAGTESNGISLDSLCANGQINSNVFRNAASGTDKAVITVSCTNSSGLTISGNTSTGTGSGAGFVIVSGVNDGITIAGNTVTGTSGTGILFKGGVTGSAVVSGNSLTQGSGAGVSIQGGAGANSGSFTVTGNDLSHNATGLKIGGDAVTDIVSGAAVTLHGNTFSAGEAAVEDNSTSGVSVKADQNWWGTSAGPVAGSITGTGANDVTPAPWNADLGGGLLSETPVASTTTASITFGDTIITAVPTALGTTTVHILEHTAVIGPTSWDGIFLSPSATTTDALVPPVGFHASGVEAVAFGSTSIPLTFDHAVKLTFAGQTGKLVGWSLGSSFEQITTLCSGDSQAEIDAYFAAQPSLTDCTRTSGDNLIVWTKRAGTFVVYTQTADDAAPGDDGQGAPSGGTAPTIVGLMSFTIPAQTATWTWSSQSGAVFRFSIDTNPGGAPSGSYGTATIATRVQGTGTFYVHVQAKDASGNISAVATASAVLDNTPPAPPSINVISPDTGLLTSDRLTNAESLTVYGTADAGSLITLKTGSNILGTAMADGNGNWNVSSVFDGGTHSLKATATDVLGNVSDASAGFAFTVDTVPPHVTLLGSNPLHLQFGHVFAEPGATASDAVDGSDTVVTTGSVDTGVIDSYTLTYTASDTAGNSGVNTRTVIVENMHVPTASNVSASGEENVPLSIAFLGNDSDGDTLSYTITSLPNNGAATVEANNAVYIPSSNFSGKDSFTYVASDGAATSSEKTVSITISEAPGGVVVSTVNNSSNSNSNTPAVSSNTVNTAALQQTTPTKKSSQEFGNTGVVGTVAPAGSNGNSFGTTVAPESGEVLGVFTYHFNREMGIGSRGDDVVALQQFLNDAGFYNGSSTGYFGPRTEAAVKAFQVAYGISSTGYVGALTIAELNLLLSGTPSPASMQTIAEIEAALTAAFAKLQVLLVQLATLQSNVH